MDPPYSLNISLGFHYVWGFYFTAVPWVLSSAGQWTTPWSKQWAVGFWGKKLLRGGLCTDHQQMNLSLLNHQPRPP